MAFDAKTLKQPWVKYALIGVAVIGGFFVLRSMSGGGGTTVVSSGADAATVQANAQLQAQANQLNAQSSAATQAQNYNLALDAQQAMEKFASDKLAAQTSTNQQQNQIFGTLQLSKMSADAANYQAGLAAATQQAMQATAVAGTTALAQIQADNAAKQIAATVTLGQAQTQAITNIAQINSNTQLGVAGINGNVAITQSNNSKDVAITQSNNQAGVSNNASDNNLWGGLATAALSFFSDRRLKRDIVRVGTHKLGIGIYCYRYIGGSQWHVGVMAQDVLAVLPAAVMMHFTGFYKVDYSLLNRA